MPQMSPLLWFLLFSTFSILFLMSFKKLFYTKMSKTPDKETLSNVFESKIKNWMW